MATMKLGRNVAVAGVVLLVLGACATGSVITPGEDGGNNGGDGSSGGCPPCSGSTPKCDTVSNKCVACLADPDCADSGPGAKCNTTTHTCKPQCTTNADCTTGNDKTCDTTLHVCVECVATNDTCPSGMYCAQGACAAGCKVDNDCTAPLDGGTGDGGSTAVMSCCNHACADIAADEKNCGKCGTTCTTSQLCCSSSCAESQTSIQNCGACGKVCNPQHVTTAQCTTGNCGYDTCVSTLYGDCDNDKTNGCEDDLTSDDKNCGKCGTACTTGQKCVNSVCVSCSTNEIAYNGHCYYLDGSGGACDTGYSRAAETVLSTIATSFVGKNYKHTISSNCCIWTSDTYENWGMAAHCNANGPFTTGDPQMGAYGCTSQTLHGTGQLTFCGSN